MEPRHGVSNDPLAVAPRLPSSRSLASATGPKWGCLCSELLPKTQGWPSLAGLSHVSPSEPILMAGAKGMLMCLWGAWVYTAGWAWPPSRGRCGAEPGWFAETAVNIGFACQLLSESMLILEEKEIV